MLPRYPNDDRTFVYYVLGGFLQANNELVFANTTDSSTDSHISFC